MQGFPPRRRCDAQDSSRTNGQIIVAFDLSAGVSDGTVTSLVLVRDRAAHRVTVVADFENHVQDLTSNGRFVALHDP